MKQSSLDPCLFYKKKSGELFGLVGSLVDDALVTGNHGFVTLEAEKCQRFDVKEK